MNQPLELANPLWMKTPGGLARAHFLICDNEQDLLWVCFLQDPPGVCVAFSNEKVRLADNATIGRGKPLDFEKMREAVKPQLREVKPTNKNITYVNRGD